MSDKYSSKKFHNTGSRANTPSLTAKQLALVNYYHARRAIFPINHDAEVIE